MSRLDELKKQYPELNMSIFDIMKRMDTSKTYKYIPLMCKIFNKRFDTKELEPSRHKEVCEEWKETLESFGIKTNDMSCKEIYSLRVLTELFNLEYFETFKEFIILSEKNKIQNNDITSYSSIDEVRGAISLSLLKEADKELESQIVKEYEDDLWLIVRPLTFASSAKYGNSTRWCTTYKNEKQYFEKYWRKGILVYFINKKTGYKFAGFKSLYEHDKEFSFWSSDDSRIDFLETKIDDYLFSVVKNIFSSKYTNKNLCSDELQEKVHVECGVYIKGEEEQIPVRFYEPEPTTITGYASFASVENETHTVTAMPDYVTTTTMSDGVVTTMN